MRRLALLCFFGLLMSAAVAWGSPLMGRAAGTSLFSAASHVGGKPARREGKRGRGHSGVTHAPRTGGPIVAAAAAAGDGVLFGDQAVESGRGSVGSGVAVAFPFASGSSGSASSVLVYVGYRNAARRLIAGLYADSGGRPGALVGFGSVSSPRGGAWVSVPIAATAVKPGTYWVGVLGEGGILRFRDRSDGSCVSERGASDGLSALPSSWRPGGTGSACPISAYVVGTADAAAPALVLPPVNTAAPGISGSAVVGDTLMASNGSWLDGPTSYSYQWQDCSGGGLVCSDISGATGGSYTLQSSDVGDTVRVVVTAANAGGSTSAASAESGVVALPPAPTNTTAPALSGSGVEGQTLSTSTGAWSNNPTGYSYAWEDCNSSGASCSAISGATASSYALASGDVGHTVRSVVTASNDGGSGSATSAASAVVTVPAPSNTAVPALSGSAQSGQVLTTTNGSWAGSPTSYLYGWEDCNSSGSDCVDISGAAAGSYTLTSSDVGHTIRSVVTASNAGGASSASSAASAVVTSPAPSAPVNTSLPAISGTVQEGDTLTASDGSWSNSPSSYGYQWEDCNSSGASCGAISGATSSSYVLASGDVGDTIRVVVTASNAGGSTPASSAASAVVSSSAPSAPANTSLPAISGETIQGQALTTSNGSWSNSPSSYRYQWEDCNSSGASCSSISGATSSSYTLAGSDVGDTIRVIVTAANAGGSTPATSAASAVVSSSAPSAPANTSLPAISGTAQQGDTLTTSSGSWSNSPSSYGYEWEDCNGSGGSCVGISGASSSSYTVQASDVGSTIRSVVTATNAGGSTSASSAATASVSGTGSGSGAAPDDTGVPVVSGQAVVGGTFNASDGIWSGSPSSYGYQWQQCNWQGDGCVNISGATSSSYTPVSGDAGHRVQVLVTATNGGGSTTVLPASESQAVASSSYRTFYISTSGSDSNSGTSTTSPWAHAPGMPGCTANCASYTGTTGDHFVFQGGDTFTSSELPIMVSNSGAAAASYYYGVDTTWYTGSSWTQPTFNDDNTGDGFFNMSGKSYIEIDGLHMTGYRWTGTQNNPLSMINVGSANHFSVTNSLIDGWSHDTPSDCSDGDCDAAWFAWVNGGSDVLFQGDQFDQSTGSYDSGGAVYQNSGSAVVFDRDSCFHVENCLELAGNAVVSNDSIYDMGSGDYDSSNHQNAVQTAGNSATIYNDVMHDIALGSFDFNWQSGGTNNIYNNVVWNTNGRAPFTPDCTYGGCNTGTSNVYNNTIVGYTNGSDGVGCIRWVNRGSGDNTYATVAEDNNHCIGTTMNSIDSGASITNLTQNTNLTQSTSQATSDGYTTSNEFAPTATSSPTVSAGTNITSDCSGDVLSLCTGFDGHSRPTGASAWNEGAYEWLP